MPVTIFFKRPLVKHSVDGPARPAHASLILGIAQDISVLEPGPNRDCVPNRRHGAEAGCVKVPVENCGILLRRLATVGR